MIKSLVRPNVLAMTAYSSARSEFTGVAEVFLDANESPFDNGLNRYPDPLQKQVKGKLSFVKQVKAENIFLGNGSDEAIDLLLRIFCEPKMDHIITLPPTYGMYKVSAALSNVDIVTVPLTNDFQPDTHRILNKSNKQSKILFLCSPNNPTGNNFEQKYIIELLENFRGIVVIDEAYIDYSEQSSCTKFLDQFPNLVVLQTFSKAWGLAAIRLGMAFANPEVIALFNKVKPPYNINQLTQEAAIKALNHSTEKEANVQSVLQQRDLLEGAINELSFIEKIYPSDANFILVKMKDPVAIYQYLLTKQIIVRDRSKILLCEGCLRITIGTPSENKRLIEAMKKFGRR